MDFCILGPNLGKRMSLLPGLGPKGHSPEPETSKGRSMLLYTSDLHKCARGQVVNYQFLTLSKILKVVVISASV